MKEKKIFVSYSHQDRDFASKVASDLSRRGLVIFDPSNDLNAGDEVFEQLNYLFQSSDSVVVLLSKKLFESKYFKFEYSRDFFEAAEKRKINIVPVLIEKCLVPSEFLAYEVFDLTKNYEKSIEKLINKLKVTSEISFDALNYVDFENLVYDLLKEYKFFNIERQDGRNDYGIDFIANHFNISPFGIKRKETWVVETKFYKNSRVDLATIHKLLNSYKYIGNRDAKILLITNSVPTSVVQDFISDAQQKYNVDFDVVDGVALKKLISKKKKILKKYFNL